MSRPGRTRVLLVGKDARTDALAAAVAASPADPEIFALAGLRVPGLVEKCAEVRVGSLADTGWLAEQARQIGPDLVIVGPEEPLEAGLVDRLEELGIPTFGPTRALAAIESSKSWARRLLDKHGIPGNPEYRAFESGDGLRAYMEELGSFVVKPDGLTAGKGVKVFGEHLETIEEALAYATEVLETHPRVQIEERLLGEEFSLQTITDGEAVVHCPPVQDHKRAFEGDRGPNTGGMGSYSCADGSLPFLAEDDVRRAQQINERTIEALRAETGSPYRGVLYGGFIATADGVRLIEYNARFGDPEAMNVLPLLDADFVELAGAAARGTLGEVSWSFRPQATVCKYIVPAEYPERSERAPLEVPAELLARPEVRWYWAACEQTADGVEMTSSRTGAFVGIGETLAAAEAAAEAAARDLEAGRAVRHRADIGTEDLVRRRIEHMESLRGPAAAGLPTATDPG
jgi:phosphoribosylamine--glycine ligase